MNSLYRRFCIIFLVLTSVNILVLHAVAGTSNTPETATVLAPNSSSSGSLGGTNEGEHWWKVTLPGDGAFIIATLNTSSVPGSTLEIDNYIYDQNGKTQLAGYLHSGSHPEDTSLVVNLLAGTYYVRTLCYAGAGTYSITATFRAASLANDTEPNDTAGVATSIAVNTSATGHLGFYGNGYTDPEDWRKVVLPSDGKLQVATVSDATLEIDNYIYDANKKTQLAGYKYGGAHIWDTSEVVNLVAGMYYIRTFDYTGYGSYSFKTIFTPAALANDTEPNDSAGAAIVFPLNSASTGHLGFFHTGYDDPADWRKVTTAVDGKLVIATLSDPTMEIDNYIYDVNKTTQLAGYKYGGAHLEDTSEVPNLGPGTYYIATNRYAGYGSYSITNKLIPAQLANDTEPNGSIALAKPLTLGTRSSGHLGYYQAPAVDDNDFFTITLPTAVDTLFVRTDSNPDLEIDLFLYNAASVQVGNGSVYGVTEFMAVPKLPAGTYYVQATRWTGFGSYYVIASTTRPSNVTVGVEKQPTPVPTEYSLSQNYPNPFNPSTTIRYAVASPGLVQVRIYDMLGRETATLVNDVKQPGTYAVEWNAGALPSGVYLCRLSAGTFTSVKKLVLQK